MKFDPEFTIKCECGTPYSDQICLNYDSVKILYNWLESYVNLTNAKIRQAERELYYERNKVF